MPVPAHRGQRAQISDASLPSSVQVQSQLKSGAVAEEVVETGGHALYVPADMCHPDAPGHVVGRTVAEFERIDGLVNNAAIVRHLPVDQWTVRGFDDHVAVNVRAPTS